MEMKFKKFRSSGDPILVASTSGHAVTLTSEFTPVPSILWADAYSLGGISEDMGGSGMQEYIESKKAEKAEAIQNERDEIKEALRSIYSNPVGVIDSNGRLVHRKAIAAIGKPVKKDLIDELWNELVQESEVS
jgi:hypothetical protein